eukprot:m.305478 g.305478  ORF g.305478 m.305478 type:complete len:125 (-) comp15907_c0_seq12:3133-3507(-)
MDRRDLLGASSNPAFSSSYSQYDDGQQLMTEQDFEAELAGQDQIVDQIGQTARQLRQYGEQIGTVLDDHNEMLEDLHEGMDQANLKLERENQHIEHVRRQAKAAGYCCTIFLLIVAIILVATLL